MSLRGSNIFSLTWLSITLPWIPNAAIAPSKARSVYICILSVCIPVYNMHENTLFAYVRVCIWALGESCDGYFAFWFAWMSHGWKPRDPLQSSSHTRGLSTDYLNRIWESWNHSCGIWLLSVYGKSVSLPLPDPNLKTDSHGWRCKYRAVSVYLLN